MLIEYAHDFAVYACCISSSIGVDVLVRFSEPIHVVEEAVKVFERVAEFLFGLFTELLPAIPAYAPKVLCDYENEQLSERFDHPFVSLEVSFVI